MEETMEVEDSSSQWENETCDNYYDLEREELLERLAECENANGIAVKELKSMKDKLTYYQQQYENFTQKITEVVQTHDMKKKAMLVILSDGVQAYTKLVAENKELKRLVEEHVRHDKLEEELRQLKMQLQEQDRKIEDLESVATPRKKPKAYEKIRHWFGKKSPTSYSTSP